MTTPKLLIGATCIGCLAAITGASAQEGTNARMERHLQRNTQGNVSAHAARQTVVGAQRVPNYRGARAAEGYAYRGQPLYAYAPNYSYQSPSYGYTYQAPSYGYAYEPGYADSYGPGYAATAPASAYYASGYNVTYADPYYDYAPGVSIGIGPVGIGVGPAWGW
jgi:hypothetical protein